MSFERIAYRCHLLLLSLLDSGILYLSVMRAQGDADWLWWSEILGQPANATTSPTAPIEALSFGLIEGIRHVV
jgi:hypothetical protein